MSEKVLVTNATGKAGRECCRALSDAGYTVFGTTRSEHSGKSLTNIGVTPVVCDYTKEMPKALQVSGAKLLLFITDFFKAAKNNADTEEAHGKHAVDAAKAAGVQHTIFVSVADAEKFPRACTHLLAKPRIEAYLRASGIPHSILRPGAFFENFDDAANFNPLKKGKLFFLMTETAKFCATYDIGRAAAVQFRAPDKWLGKSLDVIGWVAALPLNPNPNPTPNPDPDPDPDPNPTRWATWRPPVLRSRGSVASRSRRASRCRGSRAVSSSATWMRCASSSCRLA